jgi:5-hydroxyisourate hydrolase-like protein (transthyretin family)
MAITIRGAGFDVGGTVRISICEQNISLGTALVNACGAFEMNATLPATLNPGTVVSVKGWIDANANGTMEAAELKASWPLKIVTAVTNTITISPVSDSNPVGTSHPLTATVVDSNGAPVPGVGITWTKQSGPGSFISAQNITDANGQAEALITSTTAGTTVIRAAFTANTAVFVTATAVWTAVSAGFLNLTPSSAIVPVGTIHTFTATVTDESGIPLPGIGISWTRLSGPGSFLVTQTETDEDGRAQALLFSTTTGTTNVRAAVTTNPSVTDTAQAQWMEPEPTSIIVTPSSDSNRVNTNHTFTATVRDQAGNPMVGVSIVWTIQSGPGNWISMQTTTNSSGQAQAVLRSSETGTSVVRAAVEEDDDIWDTAIKVWTST